MALNTAPKAVKAHSTALRHALITQTTNLSPSDPRFRTLDTRTRVSVDAARDGYALDGREVWERMEGLVEKARIRSQDDLADALQDALDRLGTTVAEGEDGESRFRSSTLPTHLALLLELSELPAPSTHTYASTLLSRTNDPLVVPSSATWRSILAEEPFEGDHWREPSWGSSDDDEGWKDSEEEGDSEEVEAEEQKRERKEGRRERVGLGTLYKEVGGAEDERAWGEMIGSMWWERPRPDVDLQKEYSKSDPSTLYPELVRLALTAPTTTVTLSEPSAVSEVLFALLGRPSALFQRTETTVTPIPIPSILPHLSPTSFSSLLSLFAAHSTSLQQLRAFSSSAPSSPSRTLQAFASGLDALLARFTAWCGERQSELGECRFSEAGDGLLRSATLGALAHAFSGVWEDTFDVLSALLEALAPLLPNHTAPRPLPPSQIATRTLDTLFRLIPTLTSEASRMALTALFITSAEPSFASTGRFLIAGVDASPFALPAPTTNPSASPSTALPYGSGQDEEGDPEFFIVRNADVTPLEADWWALGWGLREHQEGMTPPRPVVPAFFGGIEEDVLALGKAVGLLRALGEEPFADDDANPAAGTVVWPTLSALLDEQRRDLTRSPSPSPPPTSNHLFRPVPTSPSVEEILTPSTPSFLSLQTPSDLALLINDLVSPPQRTASARLHAVFIERERCDLFHHLSAIQSLFLMRKGDVLQDFCAALFERIDLGQPWDLHFLNATFRDAVALGPRGWIDDALVRFWVKGVGVIAGRGGRGAQAKSVRALEGIKAEYQVPWPLTYVFTPSTMETYSSLFVLLLQIRRGLSLIDRLSLIRQQPQHANGARTAAEVKAFCGVRRRLAWAVRVVGDYVMGTVITAHTTWLNGALHEQTTVDGIIKLHEESLDRIREQCFLSPRAASLRRAILSILDLTHSFAASYSSYASDTPVDISLKSLVDAQSARSRRRSRHRRQRRRRRKDIIGFTQIQQVDDDSSSSSDDEQEIAEEGEGDYTAAASTFVSAVEGFTLPGETFLERLERMADDLAGLVAYVRRTVDTLARGSGGGCGGGSSDKVQGSNGGGAGKALDSREAYGRLAFALQDAFWDS